jgi:hypothetical protein
VLSGASANDAKAVNIAFRAWVGPREDRPFERYQNFVNLRTVVWGVGVLSLLLNLFALANLDFLNALLLLPSLMFSVSTLKGPFVMSPKPGAWMEPRVWVPKICGWTPARVLWLGGVVYCPRRMAAIVWRPPVWSLPWRCAPRGPQVFGLLQAAQPAHGDVGFEDGEWRDGRPRGQTWRKPSFVI